MKRSKSVIENCCSEELSLLYPLQNDVCQNHIGNSIVTIQMIEDSEDQLQQQSLKKSNFKAKKGRKAQEFTLYQDQRILTLILKFGPKFKKISRLLNGKPVNIIKNRYYRHLRYKWDEVLGEEYTFLNESKEKVNLQHILKEIPLVPEYQNIMANMILEIQTTISKCLNQTNFDK